MADAFGNYYLNLKIDDEVIDVAPSAYVFTVCDSIYSIFPKMNMTFSDSNGLMNEYLGLINGTKLTISMGRSENKMMTCSYRVEKNSVPQQYTQNSIAGDIELSLIHDWYYHQGKKCVAYNNNISDIVNGIANSYKFDSINVDDTLNQGVWYQPYMEDYKFIKELLLPFAYSTNANKTPFFFFIGCDNTFNFKNLNILNQQTPIKEFEYSSMGMVNNFSTKNINTVNFLQESEEEMRNSYHRILGHFNNKGDWVTDNDKSLISDYPSNDKNPIPIRINENNITDIKNIIDEDTYSTEIKNNRLGFEVSGLDKEFFIDKILITVNFDYRLRSGKKIKATFPIKDMDGNEMDSLRNSNTYLIETCYHKWDGNKAYTILICSKQTVKLTSSYRNLRLIVSR